MTNDDKRGTVQLVGTCSHCSERFELKGGLIPYHDHPKPLRQICKGSKMSPTEKR